MNNLYGWAISQRLPLAGVKWVKGTSQFIEEFIKSDNDDNDEWYFLEFDV